MTLQQRDKTNLNLIFGQITERLITYTLHIKEYFTFLNFKDLRVRYLGEQAGCTDDRTDMF